MSISLKYAIDGTKYSTREIGEEGTCKDCGEKKFIRASWDEKIFCDSCFDKQSHK